MLKAPWKLPGVPDQYKTQKMCDNAVEAVLFGPCSLANIPDRFKTEEVCTKAVEAAAWLLEHVADHVKTQEMCDKAVCKDPRLLKYVPDWFVTQQQLKIWDDNELISKWYDGYQKCKAQKAKIKEELMPIAWHPDRVMD